MNDVITMHVVCYAIQKNGVEVGKVVRQTRTRWCANSLAGPGCYGGFISLHTTKRDAVAAVVAKWRQDVEA